MENIQFELTWSCLFDVLEASCWHVYLTLKWSDLHQFKYYVNSPTTKKAREVSDPFTVLSSSLLGMWQFCTDIYVYGVIFYKMLWNADYAEDNLPLAVWLFDHTEALMVLVWNKELQHVQITFIHPSQIVVCIYGSPFYFLLFSFLYSPSVCINPSPSSPYSSPSSCISLCLNTTFIGVHMNQSKYLVIL